MATAIWDLLCGMVPPAPAGDSASTALSSPALRAATATAESRRRAERPAAPIPMNTPVPAPAASAAPPAAAAPATAAAAPSAATAPSSAAAPSVECPTLFETVGDRWHDLPADVQALLSSSKVEAATCAAVDRVRAERLACARQLEDEEDKKEEAGLQSALARAEDDGLNMATALKAAEDGIAALQAKRASLSSQAANNREQKARHRCALETYKGRRNRRLKDRANHDSGASSRASSADERDIPPAPSSWDPPSSPPPAAVSYAVAARSPTTRASVGSLAFRKGDSAFAKGQLADMAQAMQFNFQPGDRDRVLRAAEAVAIAMPPHSTVEDAVQAARDRGSPLLEKVEYLLGSLRAAHTNATDPVVWPGCHRSSPPPVPAFDDFTSSSKKKAPAKSGGRGSGGGGSGDSDGSHLRGSTSSHRGRAQASSSSSSERGDKKGVKKKSRPSRPSSDTAGGASSDSGSERSLPRKTSSGRMSSK